MRTTALLALLALAACSKKEDSSVLRPPAGSGDRAPSATRLPDPSAATEKAPEQFRIRLKTTKGDIVLAATRAWSPNGADRLFNLVKIGYFTDVAFFRVLRGFVAQFGMHGDPEASRVWAGARIPDDPPVQSNRRGMLTFAKPGIPNARSVQLFINLRDNVRLDADGFAPVAEVVEGMEVADRLFAFDNDAQVPNQERIRMGGNAYLKQYFPQLDYIRTATLE
jgi:peptidyl-prolyl cis-trans isomerase A (cyclophilin A)